MIRHIATRIVLAAMIAAPVSSFAGSFHLTGADKVAKGTVSVTFKNTSAAAQTIRVGDKTVTIEAGQQIKMTEAVNTRVYASGDSAKHKDGDLLVELSSSMNGVVCNLG